MNKEIVEYMCIAIILIVVVGLCLLYYIGYTIEKMRKNNITKIKVEEVEDVD
jgi:hypothetical protein